MPWQSVREQLPLRLSNRCHEWGVLLMRGWCHRLMVDPSPGQFSAHDFGECELGIRQLPRGVNGRG